MDLEYYVPEDFASDESFVNYCFQSEPKDIAFWEQWLTEHPERKKIAERAREFVYATSIMATPEEKQRSWEKLKDSLEAPSARGSKFPNHQLNVFSRTGALAAIILIVGVMVVVFYWMAGLSASGIRKAESPVQQYTTAAGQRYKMVLNDGTQVWLNADSKIACSGSFRTGKYREVILSGEAYFKVAPNTARPFIIHTQKLDVKVLGTEFNIEAYPGEKKEVASLIKGSIQVSLRADPEKTIILKPDEKIVVSNNNIHEGNLPAISNEKINHEEAINKYVIEPLKTDPLLDSGTVETAWMKGKLVFRNESFTQLSQQMERWYNVQIHFANDSLKNYCFTGIFSTETIEQALSALQLTSPSDPFDYHIEGNEVFIVQDKSSK